MDLDFVASLMHSLWLGDGDEVRLTAVAGPGVGWGRCSGILLPAMELTKKSSLVLE